MTRRRGSNDGSSEERLSARPDSLLLRRTGVRAGALVMLVACTAWGQEQNADLAQAAQRNQKLPVALTAHIENDSRATKFFDSHDRHYSSGLKLVLAAQPDWADVPLQWLESIVPIDAYNAPFRDGGKTAVGLVTGQNIYTPHTIETPPTQGDRPYAGWLYGGLFWQRADRGDDQNRSTVLDHFEVNLGVVGQSALAENTQEWWHDVIDDTDPQGWNTQLRDEGNFDFIYRRKWKFQLFHDGNFEGQIIPQAGFVLGSVHRQAEAALQIRVGWNLPDDFGVGRIDDPQAYTGIAAPRKAGFYGFVRGDGRAVEHNLFIEGNNWRSSPITAEAEPLVGSIQYGIAWQICPHFELTYSQTYFTHEYKTQQGTDSIGAFTLTGYWSF